MSLGLPFAPSSGATTGKTVKVTGNNSPSSVAGTLDSTGGDAPVILIVNNGSVLVFVRVSGEATPTATAADMPVPAGATRVIQNPKPQGITGLAVLSSTASSNDVFFTPGNGRP